MRTKRITEDVGAAVGCSITILYILGLLTFFGIVGWVAYHFISKYW